jgi:hypothetical protein
MATSFQTFNPTITNPVPIYVYDPDSGNTAQPPGNGAWSVAKRWQGGSSTSFTQPGDNQFVSNLDTANFPFRTVAGGGPHNALLYQNAPGTRQRPFGDSLIMAWGARIDSFSEVGGGVAQLSAYIYLKDPRGNFLAVLFNIYDNRYSTYTPAIGNDGSTFFASTPIGNTRYCQSNNVPIVNATLGQTITFDLTFTKAHMFNIIADLQAQGITVEYPYPFDWVVHEVGLLHEIFTFNNPDVEVQNQASFSSLNVVNATYDIPSAFSFIGSGATYSTTNVPGLQNFPDAYLIQKSTANGYNQGAGRQIVTYKWRSHRYFELNRIGHVAMILRWNVDRISEIVRINEGTGLLFGNLSGYYNENTGHSGNPLYPSTIVETWWNGTNDLLPDTSPVPGVNTNTWNGILQDDVTYDVEIVATVDSLGRSLVSYKLSAGGVLLLSIPPTLDNNTYYDKTRTGFIMGHVFQGIGEPYTPVPGWTIDITNFAITWAPLTATYTIVPDKITVNEGDRVTWTITTTNVADGTTLYWTNAGTTNGYDFNDVIVGPSTGNDGYVTVTNNSASFYKTLANDFITEGPETITIQLRTNDYPTYTVVATAATVTVNDTSVTPITTTTYRISPDRSTVNEGEMVTWNIVTTNVPDTTLYWVNTGTTNGYDFSDFVAGPSDGLSGPVNIVSGAGSFTRTLANDLLTEGPETIRMNLRTGSTVGTIVTASITVTVLDTSITPPVGTPTYVIQPAGLYLSTVNEGSTVQYNIITSNVSTGTTLYWYNAGSTTGPDFTDYNPNIVDSGIAGSVVISSNGTASFQRTLSNDNLLEGTETVAIQLRTTPDRSVLPVAWADTVYVLDSSIPGVPTYTARARQSSYNEGETAYFDVTTNNIADGTLLYFTGLTGQGFITESDFSVNTTPWRNYGPVSIYNGSGVISRPLKLDVVTEGTEYWQVQIRTGSISGPIVAVSNVITVNDNSTGLPYYEIIPDTLIVKEGGTITYTVNAYNVPIGTVLYWTTDGSNTSATKEDFVDRAITGIVIIDKTTSDPAKCTGKFKRILIKDHLSEGLENIVMRVRIGSITGQIQATAVPVQVKDTSRTPLIKWTNTGSLGTIAVGEISELSVKAVFTTSTIYPSYKITSGTLPVGLTLYRDGTIGGQIPVNETINVAVINTSTFTVSINDSNNNNLLNGSFSITVTQPSPIDYTGVYCKPLLKESKRQDFTNFIRDESIFIPNMLYRPLDPNFGKQTDLRIFIDFGIKKLSLHEYADALSQNFYKRPLSLGNIKTAVAKNTDGTIKYEFIYVEVLDKHVSSDNISVPSNITFNGVTFYPPSIPNMRSRFANAGTMTTVRNPSFTKFIQSGDSVPLGYIPFLPLCFTLPGKSATIIRKITENGFKFNTFNVEIDRVVFQNSTNEIGAKYLLLSRSSKLA